MFQFSFSFEQETYDLQLSYNKENDQLMDIYIVRLSDRQMQWLYTVDEEKGELYPNDLQTYLDTKIEIGDWLTLDLPEGYTLGDYRGDIGYCGGALISPRVLAHCTGTTQGLWEKYPRLKMYSYLKTAN